MWLSLEIDQERACCEPLSAPIFLSTGEKRLLAIIDARPVPIQSGEAVPVAAHVSVGFSFEGGEQNPRARA